MQKFINPKCAKCAHLRGANACLLHKQNLINTDTFCAEYTESPYICEICGNHIATTNVVWEKGDISYHTICAKCSSAIGTCNICKTFTTCVFETDNTIPEPPYIMHQMRQGQTIIQQQVKNPARIQRTCINCCCYKSGECQRQDGNSCEKYSCAVENW